MAHARAKYESVALLENKSLADRRAVSETKLQGEQERLKQVRGVIVSIYCLTLCQREAQRKADQEAHVNGNSSKQKKVEMVAEMRAKREALKKKDMRDKSERKRQRVRRLLVLHLFAGL